MSKKAVSCKLQDIRRDCNKDNWDRYDAIAISKKTCDKVEHFLEEIHTPLFEGLMIYPVSDGSIDLRWAYKNMIDVFTINISENYEFEKVEDIYQFIKKLLNWWESKKNAESRI